MEAQGPSREAEVHNEIGRSNSTQLTLPEGSNSVPRETEAARPPPWRGVVEVGGVGWGRGCRAFLAAQNKCQDEGVSLTPAKILRPKNVFESLFNPGHD